VICKGHLKIEKWLCLECTELCEVHEERKQGRKNSAYKRFHSRIVFSRRLIATTGVIPTELVGLKARIDLEKSFQG
jgi:hypothetical protein